HESKRDLGPEPQNWRIRQRWISSYADVILKDWLQQEIWSHLHGIIQFECFFGTERRRAQQFFKISEWITDLAVHESAGNALLVAACKRRIEARTCGELNIFTTHVARTVVEAERRIQPTI